ncbi:MarR family transcriptional regulator [Spongiactinospora gelatinilytica]|uniref:MarR family transcriptional regulator n=1 Tax=Spongiactinospora gelatinilytica TaxID=2666298 RepID=A0A2W2HEL7_9ACTN|nr:MarR family transcriptional regulator [Spongiactinospora gelatinilytica]PZG37514.1 MarR family transcriptional regulator [Spongiactinospora gelatinilytica]
MGYDLFTTVAAFRRLVTMFKRARTTEPLSDAAGVRIDRPDAEILVHLLEAGEPRRIGAIADALQVESPHITRHVCALERRGLLERVRDPGDGRAWRINLTSQGLGTAEQCRRFTAKWIGAALAEWSDSDRAELQRLLVKLADDVSHKMHHTAVN